MFCNGSDLELTKLYRVASIKKLKGYGASVIAKLLETDLKPNLYFEIKDRIIEEKNDGIRVVKKKQKTKVYGLDSSKDKRDLLIEILRERVQYHKDKFVSPNIHDEMQHMETKRNGKVEHSSTSHDDQVFSYLMALYVWYDGKNLMENFHIRKGTIKTDVDIDIEESELEDALEKKEKVDFRSAEFESNEDIARDLKWVENDSKNFKTTKDVLEKQYLDKLKNRNSIISSNRNIKNQEYNNDDPVSISYSYTNSVDETFTEIPDSFFDIDDGVIDEDQSGDPNSRHSVLQGNLASFYDMI